MLMEHIQAGGFVCPAKCLKIFADVDKGSLGVFLIPLGPVLLVKVVVVLSLSCTLEV